MQLLLVVCKTFIPPKDWFLMSDVQRLSCGLPDSVLHGGKQRGEEAKKMPKHLTYLPLQDLCPYCIEKVIHLLP